MRKSFFSLKKIREATCQQMCKKINKKQQTNQEKNKTMSIFKNYTWMQILKSFQYHQTGKQNVQSDEAPFVAISKTNIGWSARLWISTLLPQDHKTQTKHFVLLPSSLASLKNKHTESKVTFQLLLIFSRAIGNLFSSHNLQHKLCIQSRLLRD